MESTRSKHTLLHSTSGYRSENMSVLSFSDSTFTLGSEHFFHHWRPLVEKI